MEGLGAKFSMEKEKEKRLFFLDVKVNANKVNLQPQFIENQPLVAYIVTLKVFNLRFINLVWYIL